MTDKQKKPATLRVYPIRDGDNVTHYVEASSAAAAVTWLYKPVTGDPLTAMQVLAVIREKGADAIKVATSATKTE